jgi:hypothetical protein
MADEYEGGFDTEGGIEDVKGQSSRVSDKGFLEENSLTDGAYTGVTGTRYLSNNRIRDGRRPGCESRHRKYTPAIMSVDFTDHHKFKGPTDLCQTCWEQEKYTPETFDTFTPITGGPQAFNEARSDAAIRKLTKRDAEVRRSSLAAGFLTERVATPGRPRVRETASSIDADIAKDYSNPLAPTQDVVTPIIDSAAKTGGHLKKSTLDVAAESGDWSQLEAAARTQFNRNKHTVNTSAKWEDENGEQHREEDEEDED